MAASSLKIREQILDIAHESGHGHIPTCFSVVEMIRAVYGHMRFDPRNPGWEARDLFVLSKGHAALALYCVLADRGFFPVSELRRFGGFGSRFGCHAHRLKVPGVEASTGSLGHGIGIAVGMAKALQLEKSNRQVYVLIGDGESNEGSVWEAVMVAVDQKLSNLKILFDDNRSQARCLQPEQPGRRFEAFGCHVSEVDGHSIRRISHALDQKKEAVHAIVCKTVKGYGCPTLVNEMFAWHRRSPDDKELAALKRELHENAI